MLGSLELWMAENCEKETDLLFIVPKILTRVPEGGKRQTLRFLDRLRKMGTMISREEIYKSNKD